MIEKISTIARIAGMEIMKVYCGYSGLKLNVNKKLDKSPVTNADLVANKIIVYLLKNLTPDIPILSEEYVPEWKECASWSYFWLVDPLDGTKDFISHNGEFTVNIALVEYGEPIMGVVYVPAKNLLYAADHGQAWKVNSLGKRFKIMAKESPQCPVILVSRFNMCHDDKKLLMSYLNKFKNYKIINIGSSLKFCLIAEGSAQFYPRFSCTKIWDTAAGHVIAKAAGASINDWNGLPLNYKNINKSFLNPGFQVSFL